MNSTEGLKYLSELYSNKDWYHSVGLDAYGRYVVYVKFMNHETLHAISDLNGKQVLVHFAASLPAAVDNFVNRPVLSALPAPPQYVNNFIKKAKTTQSVSMNAGAGCLVEKVTQSILDKANMFLVSTNYLGEHIQKEISELQIIWGNENVENVFYEIVDGDDAVTNASDAHPDLRDRLERLYAHYGFDLICEKLGN